MSPNTCKTHCTLHNISGGKSNIPSKCTNNPYHKCSPLNNKSYLGQTRLDGTPNKTLIKTSNTGPYYTHGRSKSDSIVEGFLGEGTRVNQMTAPLAITPAVNSQTIGQINKRYKNVAENAKKVAAQAQTPSQRENLKAAHALGGFPTSGNAARGIKNLTSIEPHAIHNMISEHIDNASLDEIYENHKQLVNNFPFMKGKNNIQDAYQYMPYKNFIQTVDEMDHDEHILNNQVSYLCNSLEKKFTKNEIRNISELNQTKNFCDERKTKNKKKVSNLLEEKIKIHKDAVESTKNKYDYAKSQQKRIEDLQTLNLHTTSKIIELENEISNNIDKININARKNYYKYQIKTQNVEIQKILIFLYYDIFLFYIFLGKYFIDNSHKDANLNTFILIYLLLPLVIQFIFPIVYNIYNTLSNTFNRYFHKF